MLTISRAARRHRLSRSSLLYYHRIGLLRPSGRSPSGYRLYSAADLERLAQICRWRRMGISLTAIRGLLENPDAGPGEVLRRRLAQLEGEIQTLREQQRVIARLLQMDLASRLPGLDKGRWVALLAAAGLDEAGMRRWHAAFERLTPEGHREFLAALGIPGEEIGLIRQWCQGSPA